jgi:hypothetical protein
VGHWNYWVTWIPEGQTEEEALNSHSVGYITLDDAGVPEIGPPDPAPQPPPQSAEMDAFLFNAFACLRAVEPTLAEDVDERELVDGHIRAIEFSDELGHWIHLSPGQAWLRPDCGDGSTFDGFWRYLQILAELGPSVCESEYSTVVGMERVDTTLDVADARVVYGWD